MASEEEEVAFARVRRKLGGVLSAMDKMIADSLTDSHGPGVVGPKAAAANVPAALLPNDLDILRRVGSTPIAQRTHGDITEVLHVLRDSEILQRLDDFAAAAIAGGMQYVEYEPSAAVVPPSSGAGSGDAYLILVEGLLGVQLAVDDSEKRVGYIHPMESFGEASFGALPQGHVASARAAKASCVMRVTRQVHPCMVEYLAEAAMPSPACLWACLQRG
jgi:hypothetical protein